MAAFLAARREKKLKMPKDDIDARLSLPRSRPLAGFQAGGPKTSKLALVSVPLYSDAEKGYTGFRGELPGKLLFSDTQAEARRRLGTPAESKKQFRLDRWKLDGIVVTVQFAKEKDPGQMIGLSRPPQH